MIFYINIQLILEAAAFAVKCEHYGEKIEAGIVLKKNHESNWRMI